MAVTLTTNSTPGAPALTNVAGQLIALFDFALLPNGWNKIWSGTNAAAYQSPTSVSPVSYTHLDVYKRQEIILNTVNIVSGGQISITSGQLTEGNP